MMTSVFFFNDTATTEIYTLSLHDALPIYKDPTEDSKPWNKDEKCIHLLFHPETPLDLPDYPSHLHIDLLTRARGQGLGKIMMDHFLKNLKDRGSKGLYLGLGNKNQRAYNFYKKYGLKELKRNSDTIFMGISFE